MKDMSEEKEFKPSYERLENNLIEVKTVCNAQSEELRLMRSRLSQAEALAEKRRDDCNFLADKCKERDGRLSHLMDVVGKMADVLKPFYDSYYHKTIGDAGNCIISMKVCEDAKAMLDEWDWIKKEGV